MTVASVAISIIGLFWWVLNIYYIGLCVYVRGNSYTHTHTYTFASMYFYIYIIKVLTHIIGKPMPIADIHIIYY